MSRQTRGSLLILRVYDQGGNRLSKTDYAASARTEYYCDVDWTPTDINGDGQLEDPRSYYGTRNNRLMYYEEFDSPTPGTGNVTERVEYYYGHDAPPAEASNGTEAGSPTLIVRKLMDPQTHLPTAYHGTSLAYNHQGEVGMMIERTWTESATGGPDCESETLGRGIEFLGNGRTRYGVRQREFVEEPYGWWQVVEGTTVWSDYDGDEVYGDYTVMATKTWDEQEQEWVYGPPELHNVAAYLPGVGWMRTDPATSETTVYYAHSDHLGTLRLVSDQQSAISGVMVLTAFGEAVCGESAQNPCGTGVPPVGTRYQYAGDWGYESALGSPGHGGSASQSALPWQHVGHRWYDPSTGRFLQRDPIGITGDLNLYAYAGNNPVLHVDPFGLVPLKEIWEDVKDITEIAVGLASCLLLLAPGTPTEKVILAGGVVLGADGAVDLMTRPTSPTGNFVKNSLYGWVLLWDWFWEPPPPRWVGPPVFERKVKPGDPPPW